MDVAVVDPIPEDWILVEDDDAGWAIQGGGSYISTDEIPQLKNRLPRGNNTHIGIWEYTGASAEINFEGTGVRIYGYQPGEGGRADIYIDNQVEVSGVIWDLTAAFEPDHLFFEKTGLSEGTHTLTIKSVAPGFETLGQDNASVPNIDYIMVRGRGVAKCVVPEAEKSTPAAAVAWEKSSSIPVRATLNPVVADKTYPMSPNAVEITGLLSERLRAHTFGRIMNIDEDVLLGGFRTRPGSHPWIGEHAGGYIHWRHRTSHISMLGETTWQNRSNYSWAPASLFHLEYARILVSDFSTQAVFRFRKRQHLLCSTLPFVGRKS
jgi:hypothetical protein